MKKSKCIMIQGTMSGAGKSLLCAALCRIFRQDGYRVAPFKSQNMALNSYVTKDGLEMGRAQVMQAEAAGIEPDVRMNPVLLKPSSDTGSQVIVCGEVRGNMTASEYYAYKNQLFPEIMEAYETLAAENDIIVIEGAGSPAEINLRENDIVNMGMAEAVNAPVLLAGDIDRGGVFAQLYGTTELLEPYEKSRIEGLIINKFRGDADILKPGLGILEKKTGIPVTGVVPHIQVDIDDEDSLAPRLSGCNDGDNEGIKPVDIAVIRLPRLSNFTDFAPLEAHPVFNVRYVKSTSELGLPDLVILPGTKSTIDDLLWMRQNGLEASVLRMAASGVPVLGVCGGYQMMGEVLNDPEHVEGNTEHVRGMGLLPAETIFTRMKTRTRYKAVVTSTELTSSGAEIGDTDCGAADAGFARTFDGAKLDGYEIHMGETKVYGEAFCLLENGCYDGCRTDNAVGTYLHGLFDTGEMTERLAEYLCEKKGIKYSAAQAVSRSVYVQQQYDILADGVRNALDIDKIYEMMERYSG